MSSKKYIKVTWTEGGEAREAITRPTVKLQVAYEQEAYRRHWAPMSDAQGSAAVWMAWRALRVDGPTALSFDAWLDVLEDFEVVHEDGTPWVEAEADDEVDPILPGA